MIVFKVLRCPQHIRCTGNNTNAVGSAGCLAQYNTGTVATKKQKSNWNGGSLNSSVVRFFIGSCRLQKTT